MAKAKRKKKAKPEKGAVAVKFSASHSADAKAVLNVIEAAMRKVPNAVLLRPAQRKLLGAVAAKSDAFLEAVAVALEYYPKLVDECAVTADELRAVIRFRKAYAPVVARFTMGAETTRDTIIQMSAHYTRLALDAYEMARGFARRDAAGELARLVDEMQKALPSRSKKTKKTSGAKPQPAAAAQLAP